MTTLPEILEVLREQRAEHASELAAIDTAIVQLEAATTKSAKVKLIGNSVCPEVAEALVRANAEASEMPQRQGAAA